MLLLLNLLIPITMTLCGWIMLHHPPKQINSLYGYRTTMSMINEDTWSFAHAFCGHLWWKAGWVMLVLSAMVSWPFSGAFTEPITVIVLCMIYTIQLIVLIGSIFIVERALKRAFNRDGSRKI